MARGSPEAAGFAVGYFGASTGAAAALVAAADLGGEIGAVVSRGGRPDLAAERLAEVRAPTLLIVGGNDEAVLEMNRSAPGAAAVPERARGRSRRDAPVRGAGALEHVAFLARAWFTRFLSDGARLREGPWRGRASRTIRRGSARRSGA